MPLSSLPRFLNHYYLIKGVDRSRLSVSVLNFRPSDQPYLGSEEAMCTFPWSWVIDSIASLACVLHPSNMFLEMLVLERSIATKTC